MHATSPGQRLRAPAQGFNARVPMHGCTRLAVKSTSSAACSPGRWTSPVPPPSMACSRASARCRLAQHDGGLCRRDGQSNIPWHGMVQPDARSAPRIARSRRSPTRDQTDHRASVTSGLIYLNSHADDFKVPGCARTWTATCAAPAASMPRAASKVMKLLWDLHRHRVRRAQRAVRNQLPRLERPDAAAEPVGVVFAGRDGRMKHLVDKCMGEYDINGWTVARPDQQRRRQRVAPAVGAQSRRSSRALNPCPKASEFLTLSTTRPTSTRPGPSCGTSAWSRPKRTSEMLAHAWRQPVPFPICTWRGGPRATVSPARLDMPGRGTSAQSRVNPGASSVEANPGPGGGQRDADDDARRRAIDTVWGRQAAPPIALRAPNPTGARRRTASTPRCAPSARLGW